MKKLFLTLLVALFATVVWGQTYTTSPIPAPYSGLPQCFKDTIKYSYPKWTLNSAQQVFTTTTTKVVSGVNKTTGAKLYRDEKVTTSSYEVRLVQVQTTFASGQQKSITVSMYLSSDPNCRNIRKISSFTGNTIF